MSSAATRPRGRGMSRSVLALYHPGAAAPAINPRYFAGTRVTSGGLTFRLLAQAHCPRPLT
jgi:hypothetical protein